MKKKSLAQRRWLNFRRAWRVNSRYEFDCTDSLKFSEDLKEKLRASENSGFDDTNYRELKAYNESRGFPWGWQSLALNFPHLSKWSVEQRTAWVRQAIKNNMLRRNIGRMK